MITFVFPGQGAQYSGMGTNLFERFSRQIETAKSVLGLDIRDLCELNESQLRETHNTQPALFFVNALNYLSFERMGIQPDAAAGHSLGELNALVAAGVIDFATGLWIAWERGRCMSQTPDGQPSLGGMVAVSNISDTEVVLDLVAEEFSDFDTASINSPTQLVFAGPSGRTNELESRINALGIGRAIVLRVGAAFHSRYMLEAAERFRSRLEDANIEFHRPRCPVFSNATAEPFPEDPSGIKDLMVEQLTKPVLWMNTVQNIRRGETVMFQELGPRPILTPLIKETCS
ncbi:MULTISPECIES: ACP S-malonyltransferase [Corynebacterium]|uniref:ACP S-malonyltransferase n=1 Tax=Corynebacterium TaxID=1716 RepID=UPI0026556C56|nr:ACP S-malonyltransferase [Corynebacterium kefirresidentii]MDN8634741.1 ACP S-malonyltransferase [Corynebacterium kefirresidentii]